ncbi:serine hydrolase domain-containing protein, partial [Micropruina sp.]|uniref:serine hydrolase domain-containing protein n=1 Tax=Micropruina sp. TaxID=2737536 RepID=UPI0039E724AA
VGIGFVAGPQRQHLAAASTGDPDLAARARAGLGDGSGLRSVVVAEVTRSSIRWAGLGSADGGARPGLPPDDQTGYELGSITKTFTAALFADAIKRREVRAEDPLAKHLPELRDTPAGRVTLGSLAQHRSGLPPLGATAQAATAWVALNDNPYATGTTEVLLADAAAAPVVADQPPTYSNLGFALLGTALVRASGAADYQALVAQRVTGPLGMDRTVIAGSDADVPGNAVRGHAANGLTAPRWTGTGYLPAGTSTFTTAGDLAIWAQAQLTGRAPGTDALEPTADSDAGSRIGWAWFSTPGADGRVVTWHNGITAGFRTMLALDREAGRAVLVMGDTATELEVFAIALLNGTPVDPPAPPMPLIVVTLGMVALALLTSALALREVIRCTAILPAINALLGAVFGLLLLWTSGPWMSVGGWLWGLVLGLTLAATVILGLRGRDLGFLPERRRWLAWVNLVVGVGLVAFAVALW